MRRQDSSASTSTCRQRYRPTWRGACRLRVRVRQTIVKKRRRSTSLTAFYPMRRAYAAMMSTRPQVIGLLPTDSTSSLAIFCPTTTMASPSACSPDTISSTKLRYAGFRTARPRRPLYCNDSVAQNAGDRGRAEDLGHLAHRCNHRLSGRRSIVSSGNWPDPPTATCLLQRGRQVAITSQLWSSPELLHLAPRRVQANLLCA